MAKHAGDPSSVVKEGFSQDSNGFIVTFFGVVSPVPNSVLVERILLSSEIGTWIFTISGCLPGPAGFLALLFVLLCVPAFLAAKTNNPICLNPDSGKRMAEPIFFRKMCA